MTSCVSAHLRIPRPGPNVGNAAQGLSHDPRGVRDWDGTSEEVQHWNISAHLVSAETPCLTVPDHICLCLSGRLYWWIHICLSICVCLSLSDSDCGFLFLPVSPCMWLFLNTDHKSNAHINLYSNTSPCIMLLSHSCSHVEAKIWMFVYS